MGDEQEPRENVADRQMKRLVLFFLILASQVYAGILPVVDWTAIAHAILSYIKQGEQAISEANTEINTKLSALRELQMLENQVLQMLRAGNPQNVINLPGVSNIQTLAAIYQAAQEDVAHFASLVNPSGAASNAHQILSIYGQAATGFSSSTFNIPPALGLFQFSTADYNAAAYTQQKIRDLNQEKLTLTKQRDQAIQSEQAATDVETRTRFHNQVMSLSASIADINSQIQQTVQTGNLQQQQNAAAANMSRAAATVSGASSFGADVNAGLHSVNAVAPNDLKIPQWRGE